MRFTDFSFVFVCCSAVIIIDIMDYVALRVSVQFVRVPPVVLYIKIPYSLVNYNYKVDKATSKAPTVLQTSKKISKNNA